MSTFSVENDAATMTTVTGPSPFAKKYVTRACDICKKRKCKCDGLEVRCFYILETINVNELIIFLLSHVIDVRHSD